MAEMMRLQIVTPDEAFFDGEVSMVELNTADGEAGIYPKHIPMVVAVAPGVLKIHGADGVKKAALLSGFLQILPEVFFHRLLYLTHILYAKTLSVHYC